MSTVAESSGGVIDGCTHTHVRVAWPCMAVMPQCSAERHPLNTQGARERLMSILNIFRNKGWDIYHLYAQFEQIISPAVLILISVVIIYSLALAIISLNGLCTTVR